MPSEREVKLDVDEGFVLPDLDGVDGLHSHDRGVRLLDATYWDTDALDLMHSGFGLRHRTTDGDEGTWTVKGNSTRDGDSLVRDENDVAGDPSQPPSAALALLPEHLRGAAIAPVARVRNERHVVDVVDEAGDRWAEVADDHVAVLDGDREVARFREVEVEVTGDPDERRLGLIVARMRNAGAQPPGTGSKYVHALRALGRLPAAAPGETAHPQTGNRTA